MVHNLVSVHPKSIIIGQMTNLNMIFHVVVSVHREHTILLGRERVNRVNKGTKRMNSSPVVISCFYLARFYWENRSSQILRNTVAPNSYLGLSAQQKIVLVCIKFDKLNLYKPKKFFAERGKA